MIVGSRLQIVPSAGHMLPLEAPDVVNRAIAEFVALALPAARAPEQSGSSRRLVDRVAGWRPWRGWRRHVR
jgi:hypothetical protein